MAPGAAAVMLCRSIARPSLPEYNAPVTLEQFSSPSLSGGPVLVSAPKMANVAVFGAQWGDEGKGKIVDLLCERFDVVARYQGGHNAGHTVKFADQHFELRLIPSGILHRDKLCILGNGMVIDPDALLEEIEKLRAAGVTIDSNLKISDSAHVILPYHKA